METIYSCLHAVIAASVAAAASFNESRYKKQHHLSMKSLCSAPNCNPHSFGGKTSAQLSSTFFSAPYTGTGRFPIIDRKTFLELFRAKQAPRATKYSVGVLAIPTRCQFSVFFRWKMYTDKQTSIVCWFRAACGNVQISASTCHEFENPNKLNTPLTCSLLVLIVFRLVAEQPSECIIASKTRLGI